MSLLIKREVIESISNTLGMHPAECGGILGSNKKNIITHFEFDKYSARYNNSYVPNISYLNDIIINNWESKNIKFCGLIHSHPVLYSCPSRGDIEYGKMIIDAFDYLYKIYLPILGIKDGKRKLDVFCLYKNKSIACKIEYKILY